MQSEVPVTTQRQSPGGVSANANSLFDGREGDPAILKHLANRIRMTAMSMTNHAHLGHTGGDLSASDVLAVLYGGVLQLDPQQPNWPQRDRFLLSKGHCAAALYTALAMRGFFETALLRTFMDPLSKLNGHPDRNKLPGVEANTGPLGHGLPIAVGCAIAAKMRGETWRTFVLTGDGELQEGSNWEAAMSAQQYKLDNLIVIVDRNRLQQGDFTENTIRMEPLADKWRTFGFAVTEIDGHNTATLREVLSGAPLEVGKPTCIIANTIKGKGVSFAENQPAWHHGVPTEEQLRKAAEELEAEPVW
ncbi:transketolase [Bryocella elongata]|uniref:Transketolase n=1 Tax=Bryocella elongata TaxID=863522 RepID=A0A1H6AWY9_9BACT|nr:transketolase [Bryocella elongata]SEG53159.1 transketolase [Bryocella elongata]